MIFHEGETVAAAFHDGAFGGFDKLTSDRSEIYISKLVQGLSVSRIGNKIMRDVTRILTLPPTKNGEDDKFVAEEIILRLRLVMALRF